MPSKIYILMNKPEGYVCSAVSDRHKTIYELLPPDLQNLVQNAKRGERLHTVGRLDCDTSGLILLTNDGDFSHSLTAPENKVEKVYKVILKNEVSPEAQKMMIKECRKGVILPPEKKAGEEVAAPCSLDFLSGEECLITLTEGKFHEVKRIFVHFGNRVLSLKRLKFGSYSLPPDLEEGKYLQKDTVLF